MINTKEQTFKMTALAAALMVAYGTALAEDEINLLTKPESSISIGVGNWSGDRPQQGIYDGMREKGAYGLLDADIVKRDDETGTWLKLKGSDLGLKNGEVSVEYERQGNIGGYIEYGKTTRDNPYTINTGLQGIGTTNLTVGSNLGSFTKQDIKLGTTREMTSVGGFKNLMPGLDLKIDFKNEDKKGTRQMGWGSAALFSVEPIDSNTRQMDVILQYSEKNMQLSGGYSGSFYTNRNLQVLQQVNGVTGGTSAQFNAVTPISLPLNNQAHQFFLDGGYTFTPSTRATLKLAYTKATQNEHLPSYDLTGANAPFVNAPSNLDGRVDTTLAQLGLNSRPTSKLAITANLRNFRVSDLTPLAGYVGNNGTGVATVYNTPHSISTGSGKLEATYRLPENYNLTGGVDYSNQDRSSPTVGSVYVPFRSNLREVTYRAQLSHSLDDNLNGSLAYMHSKRNGSDYIAANGTAPWSNQINPMHIADRERDKVRVSLDWEPSDKLSVQFRIDHSRDMYPDNGRPYGIKDGSSELYAIDGNYAFSDDWNLNAWYSYDVTQAREVGTRVATTGAANATRDAHLKEIGDSLGLNLRGKLSAKLEVSAAIDWFNSTSSYPQDLALSGAGAAYTTGASGPLPEIKNNLTRFKLDAKYVLDKSSDFSFAFIHERWKTDDWSWNFANGAPFAYYSGAQTCTGCVGAGYTGVVDGTTVTANQEQVSNFLGMRYAYKFQ